MKCFLAFAVLAALVFGVLALFVNVPHLFIIVCELIGGALALIAVLAAVSWAFDTAADCIQKL